LRPGTSEANHGGVHRDVTVIIGSGGMGAAIATWVFGGMFALSLVVLLAAQELFGLSGAP